MLSCAHIRYKAALHARISQRYGFFDLRGGLTPQPSMRKETRTMKTTVRLLIVLLLLPVLAIKSPAQGPKVLKEFRGVKLGMKSDAVKAALGKAEEGSSEAREEYISNDVAITIHYDAGAVKAIQAQYLDAAKAPGWTEVVGDAPIEEMSNGAKTARKVVVGENYWVSMYRSKDGAVVRITISKS